MAKMLQILEVGSENANKVEGLSFDYVRLRLWNNVATRYVAPEAKAPAGYTWFVKSSNDKVLRYAG